MLIGFRAGHMGAIYAGCGFAAFSFAIEHFMHNSSLFKWSSDQWSNCQTDQMIKLIKLSNWSSDQIDQLINWSNDQTDKIVKLIKIESEYKENK